MIKSEYKSSERGREYSGNYYRVNNSEIRKRYAEKIANMSPEELMARRAKKLDYDRRRWKNFTPEQRALFQAQKNASQNRKPEPRRKWDLKNKDKRRISNARWLEKNRERKLKSNARWRKNNAERIRFTREIWASKNAEKIKENNARWVRNNPEKHRLYVKTRQARKLNQCPNNSAKRFYAFLETVEKVKCYYCNEVVKKEDCHVEHIIPLSRGGLHVDSNLCIACATCNLRKSTKLPSQITFMPQPLLNL